MAMPIMGEVGALGREVSRLGRIDLSHTFVPIAIRCMNNPRKMTAVPRLQASLAVVGLTTSVGKHSVGVEGKATSVRSKKPRMWTVGKHSEGKATSKKPRMSTAGISKCGSLPRLGLHDSWSCTMITWP